MIRAKKVIRLSCILVSLIIAGCEVDALWGRACNDGEMKCIDEENINLCQNGIWKKHKCEIGCDFYANQCRNECESNQCFGKDAVRYCYDNKLAEFGVVCLYDALCVGGKCEMCGGDASFCINGSKYRQCNNEHKWDEFDCGNEQCVQENGKVTCKEKCSELATMCANDLNGRGVFYQCRNGVWNDGEPCPHGYSCTSDGLCGECSEDVCDGNRVKKCVNGKFNKNVVECEDKCVNGNCVINPVFRCNENQQVELWFDSMWIAITTCANGCDESNGICHEICNEGDIKCQYGRLYECKKQTDESYKYGLLRECAFGCNLSNNMGTACISLDELGEEALKCEENKCVGNEFVKCDNGRFTSIDVCDGERVCHGGKCVNKEEIVDDVCTNGDTKCENDIKSLCVSGKWENGESCQYGCDGDVCSLKSSCVNDVCDKEAGKYCKDGDWISYDERMVCECNEEICKIQSKDEESCNKDKCENDKFYKCEGRKYQIGEICGDDLVCADETRCQECRPGDTSCKDGRIKRCDDKGFWGEKEACGDNLACLDDEKTCAECLNEDTSCTGNMIKQCKNGVWDDAVPCGDELECFDNKTCEKCKEGSVFCSDNSHVYKCENQKEDIVECTDENGGQNCVMDGSGAVCQDICGEPGKTQCFEKDEGIGFVSTCDGTNWGQEEQCSGYVSCDKDGALCGECKNSESQCEQDDLKTCVVGKWKITTCEFGCDTESKKCKECDETGNPKCKLDENSVGTRTICENGVEKVVSCGNVSCTDANECGECLNDKYYVKGSVEFEAYYKVQLCVKGVLSEENVAYCGNLKSEYKDLSLDGQALDENPCTEYREDGGICQYWVQDTWKNCVYGSDEENVSCRINNNDEMIDCGVCKNGTQECVNNGAYRSCSKGSWNAEVSCETDEICKLGSCVPDESSNETCSKKNDGNVRFVDCSIPGNSCKNAGKFNNKQGGQIQVCRNEEWNLLETCDNGDALQTNNNKDKPLEAFLCKDNTYSVVDRKCVYQVGDSTEPVECPVSGICRSNGAFTYQGCPECVNGSFEYDKDSDKILKYYCFNGTWIDIKDRNYSESDLVNAVTPAFNTSVCYVISGDSKTNFYENISGLLRYMSIYCENVCDESGGSGVCCKDMNNGGQYKMVDGDHVFNCGLKY